MLFSKLPLEWGTEVKGFAVNKRKKKTTRMENGFTEGRKH